MKKRIVIISVIAALTVCVVTAWAFFSIDTQRALRLKYPDKPIGLLEFKNDYSVQLAPGIVFKVNTARAMSTISQKQLQLLKEMGCAVDSTVAISIGRNHRGEMRVTFKRYTVSLPVIIPRADTDSCRIIPATTNTTDELDNIIYNVDFAPLADAEEDTPTLAIDFIENFLVEYRNSDNSIALHTTLPEKYSYVGDLEMTDEFIDHLRISNRYYMNMTVNHSDSRDFFIDTAMDGAGLKLPAKNAPSFKVIQDSVKTPIGMVNALVDTDVHVEYGDRGTSTSAYYFDDGVEDYSINPFNFFKWDGIIDFPHRKVYKKN